jgi:M6 family metalloprotease-like protein
LKNNFYFGFRIQQIISGGEKVSLSRVILVMPKEKLFVGSYYRIPVVIKSAKTHVKTKLSFEDLRFEVSGGNMGGIISPSRDSTFVSKRPDIMLLVGYKPGDYEIHAIHAKTATIVAKGKFSVDTIWKDEDSGPSKWFTGIASQKTIGAAWGGGTSGPQNINILPTTGTRRIAILLVDTSSQRFTSNAPNLQNHRDRWLNAVFNGITEADGVTRSSRIYYRELSYNNFDLSAQVFGPVSLTGTWDDYYNADGIPKGAFWQACVTASDGLIDFTQFDTLLCVSQQVDGPPRKGAWPCATVGSWGPFTTAEGPVNIGIISMPNDWDTVDNRELYETFSHELGHNLGLGDQYTPGVPGRNLGSWELMAWEDPLPHTAIVNRMILGWVPAGSIQTFNFQSMAAPIDQTVQLHPAELGTPPAGKKSAVEIRLADGWNYYLEYRKGQVIQIGDRSLPTDSRVLGTDAVSSPYTPPILRPSILLLNNDVDGDGAVLGNGQDYKETDSTDPVYPTDFKVEVSGIDGTKADVRIKYGVNSRPDPSIRPWPAAPDRPYQSPDIEVINAKNQADPSLHNVPWVGNYNTIVAKIKNNGGLDAPAVRVNFYVLDYTINPGGTVPETFIGTCVKDVPKNATVDFTCDHPWVPPSQGHFCIVVRIPLYQLPSNPAVVEMTELNNIAQSNYDHFISSTASPPSRESTSILVGNPYAVRTRIWLIPGHNNPLYRTYLENSWLYLNPGERRYVKLMLEYAPDNITNGIYPAAKLEKYMKYRNLPNDVSVKGFVEDPRVKPHHVIQPLGGIQAQVVTGRATKFDRLTIDVPSVGGSIVTVDDNKPVDGGKVIIRLARESSKKALNTFGYDYTTVAVSKGAFSAKLQIGADEIKCYYIPTHGLGECETETRKWS